VPNATAPTASSAALVAPKRPPALPDATIARAVERHLQEDGALRSEAIEVAVHQGVADLSGSVRTLLAKERAVGVAETIRGVRSVVDQLLVTPAFRGDEALKRDVERALQSDLATRGYTVGVAVKDGTVTLSGTTDSWQQRRLFGAVAKAVKGVRGLDDAIRVHGPINRPEAEILADIRRRIASDVWLDGDVVDLTIAGRTVHLSGVVGSAAQQSRLRADAWVSGVESVEDGGVTVDWSRWNDQRSVSELTIKSDADIVAAVRDAYRFDPRLKLQVPKVDVKDGVVMLSGNVDDALARRAAAADAMNTVGVWKVRDELTVEPSAPPTDRDIEAAAKRALAEDLTLTNGKSIEVSSANGKVVLRGAISAPFERFDAIDDVTSIPGVVEVDDMLTIDWTPAEVRERITDRLYWDPMVERERVTVAVGPDGVATLTGTLGSWSEVRAATDDALRGGAKRVVNLLALRKPPELEAPSFRAVRPGER
jgi:osmotically-inducible protein OsmY